jgi:hypothetical protein
MIINARTATLVAKVDMLAMALVILFALKVKQTAWTNWSTGYQPELKSKVKRFITYSFASVYPTHWSLHSALFGSTLHSICNCLTLEPKEIMGSIKEIMHTAAKPFATLKNWARELNALYKAAIKTD